MAHKTATERLLESAKHLAHDAPTEVHREFYQALVDLYTPAPAPAPAPTPVPGTK